MMLIICWPWKGLACSALSLLNQHIRSFECIDGQLDQSSLEVELRPEFRPLASLEVVAFAMVALNFAEDS